MLIFHDGKKNLHYFPAKHYVHIVQWHSGVIVGIVITVIMLVDWFLLIHEHNDAMITRLMLIILYTICISNAYLLSSTIFTTKNI